MEAYVLGAESNYVGVFLTLEWPRGCHRGVNRAIRRLVPGATVLEERWIRALNRLITEVPLTLNGGDLFAQSRRGVLGNVFGGCLRSTDTRYV